MRPWAMAALLAGAMLCGMTGGAIAQEPGGAPQESRDERNERDDDPSKFFWFHRAGAGAEIVRADIEYCLAQTSTIQARRNQSTGQGGLIGALVEGVIYSIMEGVETRRMRDAGMRKCMGLYGYDRYRVAEPEWNAMMRAPDAVDRLVGYASGPTPTTERLPR